MRSRQSVLARAFGAAAELGLVVITAFLLPGCQVDVNPPRKGSAPIDATPRAQVDRITLSTEPVASDSDRDGVADTVLIHCYLFRVRGSETTAVFGKGSFRFEVYDGNEPADVRQPISQCNLNFEDSLPYRLIDRYNLPCYEVPLKIGRPAPHLRQAVIIGYFYPEGADEPLVSYSPAVAVPGGPARPTTQGG